MTDDDWKGLIVGGAMFLVLPFLIAIWIVGAVSR